MTRLASLCSALALAALLGSPGPARAVSLTLQAPLVVGIGSPFSIEVTIHGLGTGVAPTLRSFDLDVSFASGLLAIDEVQVDPGLDPPGSSSIATTGSPQPGVVDVAWISLAPSSTLTPFQLDVFRLAVIDMRGLFAGETSVCLSQTELGGLGGVPIEADPTECQSLSIVPEADTALLLALGLGALGRMGWRRRRRGGGIPLSAG